MSRLEKEWQVKMELVASITQSQSALARILNSIADLADHSPNLAKRLKDNVSSLTGLQEMIARNLAGITWRRPSRGKPGRIWLANTSLRVARGDGQQSDRRNRIEKEESSWTANVRSAEAKTRIALQADYRQTAGRAPQAPRYEQDWRQESLEEDD